MKKFKKFFIEITNVCNLACSFCPQTKRNAQFMDITTFTKILDQIKPHTDFIFYHVKGEPLLHPLIGEFLDISHNKGFKVNITTNGTLINKVKDKLIGKPALRQINFSIHSLSGNKEYNNKEQYLKNIIDFAKEATKDNNIFVSLRLWNLELDNSVNQEKKRNDDLLKVIEYEFNLPFKILEKVIPGSGVKLANNIFLNQDSKFEWPDLSTDKKNIEGFCYGLRTQIATLVDGTVVPCCLDGEGIINLGNIHNTPFIEIIESERANNIYNGFSRRVVVEELCKRCRYRNRIE